MEQIEEILYSSYETAREYRDLQKDDKSSGLSDTSTITIELLQRMNISNHSDIGQ